MAYHRPPGDRKDRFGRRAEVYERYRPAYPPALYRMIGAAVGIEPNWVVADVGSGTGKLSRTFLNAGHSVIGVEPNAPMRGQAEALLADDELFESVDGSAESTGLGDGSVHLIVAGQAFHWFSFEESQKEFRRILKPGGWVALVWNKRLESDPFLADYESFLHSHSTDYTEAVHRNVSDGSLKDFLGSDGFQVLETDYAQAFGLEDLLGRYQSSSYAYHDGDRAFPVAREALRAVFETHAVDGQVQFRYKTRAYLGQM